MIIWIASYPKSGNTWVRSFLTSLLYSKNGINDFSKLNKITQFPNKYQFKNLVSDLQNVKEIYRNWKNAQDFINLDNKIKLLKTHHVNCTIEDFQFTNNANSLGAIYIVRDPRTVLISLKNHFNLESFSKAKDFILNEKKWVGIKNDKNDIDTLNKTPTLISSWRVNYLSWKNKIQNYMLIKYEDLVQDPYKEFFKISKYLENLMNCKFDENKINNAINSTSFEKLQKLEEKGHFKEYDKNTKFFYLGPNNDWKSTLENEIIEEINLKFKNEMQELGYL